MKLLLLFFAFLFIGKCSSNNFFNRAFNAISSIREYFVNGTNDGDWMLQNSTKFNEEELSNVLKQVISISLNQTEKFRLRNNYENKTTKKAKSDKNENIVTKKQSDGSFRTQIQEKARLQNMYGKKITGVDFEHEHIIGAKVLYGKLQRGEGEGKNITYAAPAYFEIKELHRKHAGTGSG